MAWWRVAFKVTRCNCPQQQQSGRVQWLTLTLLVWFCFCLKHLTASFYQRHLWGHFVHGGNTPSKSLNSTLISTSVDWIFDSWGVDHEFEGITPQLVMVKSLRCEHWYQVLVWSQWACNDNKMLDCVLKHNLNEFSLNQFRVITFIEKCFAKYTQCIQYSVCILLFSQTVFHGQYFHYQMPRSLSTWLGWLELN